jgi:hypothetical protein
VLARADRVRGAPGRHGRRARRGAFEFEWAFEFEFEWAFEFEFERVFEFECACVFGVECVFGQSADSTERSFVDS